MISIPSEHSSQALYTFTLGDDASRDTLGINHHPTSNTAMAQHNVMAKAKIRIGVCVIGFLHLSPTSVF
jgi:hypothetical protein